jgi:MFS superfamily sulfate permease-like transporter
MSVDQGIGLAGIIVAVLLAAFVAVKKINRSRNQRQSVGKGGTGIQSGRDTNIQSGRDADMRG